MVGYQMMKTKKRRNIDMSDLGGLCKKISVVSFVLLFISSFFLACAVTDFDYFEPITFVVTNIVAFISVLPMYVLGKIHNYCEYITKNSNDIYHMTREIKMAMNKNEIPSDKTEEKPATPPVPPPPVIRKPVDGWICTECGTMNEKNTQYCRDCGKYI